MITCIKGNDDFTKGKSYPVVSNTNGGMIAIKNDNNITHIVLNHNKTNYVGFDYFEKFFVRNQDVNTIWNKGDLK